jgi:hypothetical protein
LGLWRLKRHDLNGRESSMECRRTRSALSPRLCRLSHHGRPRGRAGQLTDRRGFSDGGATGEIRLRPVSGHDRRLQAWHSGEKQPTLRMRR